MLSGKATNTNRPWFHPPKTQTHTLGEYANHYTTDIYKALCNGMKFFLNQYQLWKTGKKKYNIMESR
jgi:hypothetical protein